MSELILQTRVSMPPLRQSLIERPHITAALPHQVLTLVCAPAGFGKSTLLTAWAHRQETAVAWLALEPADNELSRWVRYLVAAFESCGFSFASVTDEGVALHQLVQHAPEDALRRFLNALAIAEQPPLLALDDYHFIDNPDIHDAMCFLLEHWPQQGHVVLATREAPPFPLAQWQVKARMLSLQTDTLRFRRDESATFLRQTMGLSLPDEVYEQIHAQTEGWAAGLQLAALAMHTQRQFQGQQPTPPQVSLCHERVVISYVEQELLAQQPDEVREFLLQTSILDRFNAALCAHITEGPTGDALAPLQQLEQAQLFLVPLGADPRHGAWYRYHHLFAQILRGHLQQTQPALAASLHRKAGHWFAEAGMMTEALQHALAAEDWQQAAVWLGPYIQPLQEAGENWSVAQWLERLPQHILREQPHLGLAWISAKTTMLGRTDDVDDLLNAIERDLLAHVEASEATSETTAQQQALLALLFRTQMELAWHQRDYETAHRYADRLKAYIPEENEAVYAYFHMLEGYILDVKTAPPEQVRERFESSVALAQKPPRQWSPWIFSSWGLAWVDLESGEPHRSARRCQRILDEVARHPASEAPPAFMLAAVYAMLAHLSLEWHDNERALSLAEEAISRLHRNLSWEIHHYIKAIWAYAQYVNDRVDDAEETLLQTMRGFPFLSPRDPICASLIPFQLRRGDLNAAIKWAESCQFTLDEPFSKDWIVAYNVYISVLMAQGQLSQARAWLDALTDFVSQIGRARHLLDLQLLETVLLASQGQIPEAIESLQQVIQRATPGGYIRPFLEQHTLLSPIFAQLPPLTPAAMATTPAEQREKAYLQLLWSLMTGAPASSASHDAHTRPPQSHITPAPPTPSPENQLSRRELEILQEVAEGHTNREIAAKLYISAETVKTHLKNIYQKLEVKNRTHAVLQARQRGWITQERT